MKVKPYLNEEIVDFLRTIEPVISKSASCCHHQSSFALSCLEKDEEENTASNRAAIAQQQLSLLELVNNVIDDQRQNGTFYLTMKNTNNNNNNTESTKLEAVKCYKDALKAAQWILGFFCSSKESVLMKSFKETNEVLTVQNLMNLCVSFRNQQETTDKSLAIKQEILDLFLFTGIFPAIAAMLSNGALALIQEKQFRQAQRWCERGIAQTENFLKAFSSSCADGKSSSVFSDEEIKVCVTIFNLELKLFYRLGLALEGQNAFDEAIGAFDKCVTKAKKRTSDDRNEGLSLLPLDEKLLNQMANDAGVKLNQCREKRRQQIEKQKGSLSAMF